VSRIRVLVVDDHLMFAEAVEMLLAAEDDIEVMATMATAEEALALAEREAPDVVLMDIDLPGVDGIDATRRLRELSPATQVVIVTGFQEAGVVARAIEAGACCFLSKTQAIEWLGDTIRRAAAGELVLPAGDVAGVLSRLREAQRARHDAQGLLSLLTSREIQILQLTAEGRSTPQVAQELFISPFTVQTHLKNILAKLGVHSKLEAVTFCIRHGAIRISPESQLPPSG
jgi:DNA-binding NarL/FixJ family response regulator